ncbi:phospholipase D-like domain-containing protein [Bacillus sp. T3]|uniref:phospholipase D-like domain-containing protein n=1 Tax=Bacillus sp. T3 TaxID=467262 RepID=UPI002981EE5B|nr:phospholipase D-like domain-containing protein [Bacillus sp. T3]
MYIVLIGFALLFILIILLYIDYILGRKKHVATSTRKEFPLRNCELRLFIHGTELFEDLFQEIKKATKHIHVLFYIARNDDFSKKFYSLLEQKAREGVEVRLLLDWVGSHKLSKQIIAELEAANVQFAFAHVPKFPYLFYKANVRNHRKITVIDGVTGYLGGFNVGKEYVDQDPKLSPWRDYHMRLRGDIVHDLQTQFIADWQKATKSEIKVLSRNDYFPYYRAGRSTGLVSQMQAGMLATEFGEDFAFNDIETTSESGTNHQNHMSSPEKHDRRPTKIQAVASEGIHMEDLLSHRIHQAKKSIFIGTPYFIPSKRLLFDLLVAAKRGVHIKILVPQMADHILVQEASYYYFRQLLKAGVEVYQFLNGFYHAKALLFDDEIFDIGTTNFDQRSIFLNYEINCFITDPTSIAEIKSVIDKDLDKSKRLQLADLENVSMMTKVKEWVAKPIARFL